ncbi:MAG: SpoIID/LytB domain-containing protein [Verrucomicrobia bacterium]|nr:SpoIID/LytB domain-containing protein [Verrucomicrobiota bacterium]
MNWTKTVIACSLCISAIAPSVAMSAATALPTDLSQQAKPATIKVLISRQKDNVLLEVKGRYIVYDPVTGLEVGNGISTKRAQVVPCQEGIQWKELFPGISQIRIVPGDSQSTILVDGIEYRGCVELYDVNGKLNIVNEVDIERYLKSVMTTQFSQECDEEVMEAIAIIARTNAYYLVNRKPNAYFHVEAQEVGYQGHALTLQNLHLDKAINNTRHVVMTYQHQPFAATWTKDSAGKTADYATIFRKAITAPHGVASPYAAYERPKHGWSFAVSKQELARIAGAAKVTAIDLYQDKNSEKVYGVRIKEGEKAHDVDFFKLQNALGANRLRSNDFTVKLNGDQIVFNGYGEGHGVGLCLLGALSMAEHGANTQKILATFFPDTKLENIRTFSSENLSH